MEPITRRQAELRGLSERDIERLVADESWVRLRRGWFLTRPVAGEQDRHLRLLDTFLADYDGRAVAGYGSAALRHGLALHNEDLSTVHLCRLGRGRSKRALGFHLHAAARRLDPVDGVEHLATTVVQLASGDLEAGLVAGDDALHRQLINREQLERAALASRSATGAAKVAQLLQRADGRHESAGETLAAMRLREAGIDLEAQFAVPGSAKWTQSGQGYRTDFRVSGSRLLIEFDGKLKYAKPEALWEEKKREDRIRSLGWMVVRLTWADLFNGRAAAKVRAALAMAA
ncbi:hypothetical protein [Calidifontibacter terrae]